MKHATIIKMAAASALMALLAACGGGGGGSAAPESNVPWGSPAVFVAPGQASASFAMQGCTLSQGMNESSLLSQTKLVINAQGDVSIIGTTSNQPTATTSELASMSFALASYANWRVLGTVETPTYTIEMYRLFSDQVDAAYSSILMTSTEPGGTPLIQVKSDDGAGKIIANCILTEPLALKTLVNPARVAKHMGNGVTEIDTRIFEFFGLGSSLPSGVTGNIAFWSIPEIGGIGNFPQQNYQFNLVSGSLMTSIGTDTTAPLSTVSFALPAANSGFTAGLYSESVCRNNAFYDSNEAKSLVAVRVPDGEMSINSFTDAIFATRYANKLMPLPIIFALLGLETGPARKTDCPPPNTLDPT
jgi:hypothetical protein